MQLDHLIETKLTEEQFLNNVQKFLHSGEFTPDDITNDLSYNYSVKNIPLFYYRKEYKGIVHAELGIEKTDAQQFKDLNTPHRSITYIEWQSVSFPVQDEVQLFLYAGEDYDDWIVNFFESIWIKEGDLKHIPVINLKYDKLGRLFKYDKSVLWRRRGITKAYSKIRPYAYSKIRGERTRNYKFEADFFDKISFSLIYQFWIFNYKYDNEYYQIIMDGLDSKRLSGTRPIDKTKKNKMKLKKLRIWLIGLCITSALSILVYLYFSKTWYVIVLIMILGIMFTNFCSNSIRKISKKEAELKWQSRLANLKD